MQNLNKLSKTVLFFSLVFFSIWFGGNVLRHAIIYQFFDAETMALKPILNHDGLNQIFQVLLPVFVLNSITFPLFVISFLLFIFLSKVNLKLEGWLFITVVIIAVLTPFELYLIIIDYKIINMILTVSYDTNIALSLVLERLEIFNSFPLIQIICYFFIIFLFIFRPLKKVIQ